jgi:SAM-dependent methyltransferase
VSGFIYERPAIYDQIYHAKDYASETDDLVERLEDRGVTSGDRVLEAACGTGLYLEHLQSHYDVSGFDINPVMLEHARDGLDDVELFTADMQSFSVDRSFDAVLCLFSSIGYADGVEGLEATARCFRKALRPGGVVIIDPWVMESEFIDGLASMQTYQSPERKIARQVVAERDGRLSPMEFHWLVADQGEGVEHASEIHELYLFTRQEYEEALESAGFEVHFDPTGLMKRGLFTGVAQ